MAPHPYDYNSFAVAPTLQAEDAVPQQCITQRVISSKIVSEERRARYMGMRQRDFNLSRLRDMYEGKQETRALSLLRDKRKLVVDERFILDPDSEEVLFRTEAVSRSDLWTGDEG